MSYLQMFDLLMGTVVKMISLIMKYKAQQDEAEAAQAKEIIGFVADFVSKM